MTTENREESRQEEMPKGESEGQNASANEPATRIEVKAEEVKTLLNNPTIGTQNNFFGSNGPTQDKPLEDLPGELPSLPPGLHPFRDPGHDRLLSELESRRILLLTSYQERAAYAAAFSLVTDGHFGRQRKRALFPTRKRDRERPDLDLVALTEREILGEEPQILLIDINSWCTLFDSILTLSWGIVGTVLDRLEDHSSYLVLAVDEDLLRDEAKTEKVRNSFSYYPVSHLRYLFARDLPDRAEDLEKRLLSIVARRERPMELRELYQRVADRLAEGMTAFEDFIRELEEASCLPRAVLKERFQPIQAQDVFREGSEIHRTAAFVATYFPDLSQRDFDRFVLLLLGDETSQTEERWSNRWLRSADRVFRDCYLRTVTSGDGSWVVDFSEPYLRRELRAYLERHFSWYIKRQCQALQDSGILFAMDLSRTAVEGLVRLYVERAIEDPTGFGSIWLLDLVRGLRIQFDGEPPSGSPQETLAWLLERLVVEAHLRAHFHGRLSLLIREMLDRETLRSMVREFFEFLIAAKQHDVLLDVILELARRLRFAPHFDALVWMRRLLDQGSKAVRERTAQRLVTLARESGPRIYEFLAVVRKWLPEAGRPPERYSFSNFVALEFPFAYCLDVARTLPSERFGVWPSRHPLFYALPNDPAEARKEIAGIVEWILDPRGAALETADETETMRTAEVVRFGHVADLVEHWAWVLEGGSEDGSPEGRALFGMVVEEIDRRISEKERSWLQRSWRRRQDDYLRLAASDGSSSRSARTLLIARRTKLDQLRTRFAGLAHHQTQAASETREDSAP